MDEQYPSLTYEEAEAQRSEVIFPKYHRQVRITGWSVLAHCPHALGAVSLWLLCQFHGSFRASSWGAPSPCPSCLPLLLSTLLPPSPCLLLPSGQSVAQSPGHMFPRKPEYHPVCGHWYFDVFFSQSEAVKGPREEPDFPAIPHEDGQCLTPLRLP